MIIFQGSCEKCATRITVEFPKGMENLVVAEIKCPCCVWKTKRGDETIYVYLNKVPEEFQPANEPTLDEISIAILEMLNTLLLVDGPETPFHKTVKQAIQKFDKPELRAALVNRLYHPEKYVPSTNP